MNILNFIITVLLTINSLNLFSQTREIVYNINFNNLKIDKKVKVEDIFELHDISEIGFFFGEPNEIVLIDEFIPTYKVVFDGYLMIYSRTQNLDPFTLDYIVWNSLDDVELKEIKFKNQSLKKVKTFLKVKDDKIKFKEVTLDKNNNANKDYISKFGLDKDYPYSSYLEIITDEEGLLINRLILRFNNY